MLCKDYGICRYKPTLSKPGLGQGSGPGAQSLSAVSLSTLSSKPKGSRPNCSGPKGSAESDYLFFVNLARIRFNIFVEP